jgi:hypothetical protein
MLEIIMLIILSKRIGNIAESKGLQGGAYKALLVGLWIVGEILGIVAYAALDGDSTLFLLMMSFAGAGIGGAIAFAVANNAKPVIDEDAWFELGPASTAG